MNPIKYYSLETIDWGGIPWSNTFEKFYVTFLTIRTDSPKIMCLISL